MEERINMKEKFNNIYPIINCILVISTLIFKSFDSIIWCIILILNSIFLSIVAKDNGKLGVKIFSGIIIVLSIVCIFYKIYESIL